jgi:hypothetical protein
MFVDTYKKYEDQCTIQDRFMCRNGSTFFPDDHPKPMDKQSTYFRHYEHGRPMLCNCERSSLSDVFFMFFQTSLIDTIHSLIFLCSLTYISTGSD